MSTKRSSGRISKPAYNLGLAFLEQGLYDEAVAEFQWPPRMPAGPPTASALISQSWKRAPQFPRKGLAS